MYMNNRYMSIIVISSILGISIGVILKDDIKSDKLYIDKENIIEDEIELVSKEIENLIEEKTKIEQELDEMKNKLKGNPNTSLLEEMSKELSYTDIVMDGVEITIDADNEETGNIANLVEYNKILINIVNDLKINGATKVEINGERLNLYSEMILAGNHININFKPIAPPYKIKAAGEKQTLDIYIDNENSYINRLEEQYPLKVDSKEIKNIAFSKKIISHELELIEGD